MTIHEYRARRPRLDRDVALKVLRPEVAQDSDRLRRFEREAKTAAALNHPPGPHPRAPTREFSPFLTTNDSSSAENDSSLAFGDSLWPACSRLVLRSRLPLAR